jgi:hypothetical protein
MITEYEKGSVKVKLNKMPGDSAFVSVGNENGIEWPFDSNVLPQNLMAKYRGRNLELRFETGIYSDTAPELGFVFRGQCEVHKFYWSEESKKAVKERLGKLGIEDGKPIPGSQLQET